MLGHIMNDYRIAAAMENMFHKPLSPDGKNAVFIAKSLRYKALEVKQQNHLEFLSKLSFDSKNYLQIPLNSVEDFPKLKRNEIIKYITYGSFYLNQAKSYFEDLILNQKLFILKNYDDKKIPIEQREHFRLSFNKTRIIGAEFKSRHGRGVGSKIYKTIVQYVPFNSEVGELINSKNYKLVIGKKYNSNCCIILHMKPLIIFLGHLCKCIIGKKIAGTCTHVAALIYYLSCAKYQTINLPAAHLNNLLVDPTSDKSCNNPEMIKNKRNKLIIEENSSESENEVYDNDFFSDKYKFLDKFNDVTTRPYRRKKVIKKTKKDEIEKKFENNIEETHSISKLLTIESILSGEWLTDNEINVFLENIREFNKINGKIIYGLSDPIEAEYRRIKKTRNIFKGYFVEIFLSRENHWVCVAGGPNSGDVDVFLYDSMSRTSIDDNLGEHCSLILPNKRKNKGYIVFEKKKSQYKNRISVDISL